MSRHRVLSTNGRRFGRRTLRNGSWLVLPCERLTAFWLTILHVPYQGFQYLFCHPMTLGQPSMLHTMGFEGSADMRSEPCKVLAYIMELESSPLARGWRSICVHVSFVLYVVELCILL